MANRSRPALAWFASPAAPWQHSGSTQGVTLLVFSCLKWTSVFPRDPLQQQQQLGALRGGRESVRRDAQGDNNTIVTAQCPPPRETLSAPPARPLPKPGAAVLLLRVWARSPFTWLLRAVLVQ
ncbi:hypothetical protein E2C01_001664 [Portunus trituberculatus]|uniref:Uncharacterized protein n=1 Tax=Portunus trituberculatus TaxID=210409 RepID=A0A5B7CH87_PORTR|nr:hypothetical protein [Portunus trituberculatus]